MMQSDLKGRWYGSEFNLDFGDGTAMITFSDGSASFIDWQVLGNMLVFTRSSNSGRFTYEFNLEGNSLMLKSNQSGEWMSMTR